MTPDIVSAKVPDAMMLRADIVAGIGQICDASSTAKDITGLHYCHSSCPGVCVPGGIAAIFLQVLNSTRI